MRKKGQAAMEFLMTYGWAILAAVIVVGVLWYLLGNPQSQIGDRAELSAPLFGNAIVLNTTGISVEIKNNGADEVAVWNVSVTGCGSTDYYANGNMNITQGNQKVSSIACAGGLTVGDTVKEDITVYYSKEDSSLIERSSGTVSGTVTG